MTLALEQRFYSPDEDPSTAAWLPVADANKQSDGVWRLVPIMNMRLDLRAYAENAAGRTYSDPVTVPPAPDTPGSLPAKPTVEVEHAGGFLIVTVTVAD
jgi:hypothetical protein